MTNLSGGLPVWLASCQIGADRHRRMTAVGALNGLQTLLCELDVRVQKLDVIVRGPRRGLCRRLEIEEGEGKSEQLGERKMFCIRVPRLVKAARMCAAKRSRALTSLGPSASLLLRRNTLESDLSG